MANIKNPSLGWFLIVDSQAWLPGADPGISVRGGAMMDDTGDHLSGAPPLVGAERTRKFWDFDTPQIIGNGTFELEIADLL